MLAKVPRAGFFVAIGCAALAIVGGAVVIFFEVQDHTGRFLGPVAVLAAGIALLALTVLGERPGRAHGIVVGLRNFLIALFAVALVLVIVLVLVGPYH